MGLATDTTVYLRRRGKALEVNKRIFTIRASDSAWHFGLPLFPRVTSELRGQFSGASFTSGFFFFFFITLGLELSDTKVYEP